MLHLGVAVVEPVKPARNVPAALEHQLAAQVQQPPQEEQV